MAPGWKEILSVWVPGIPKPGGSKIPQVVCNTRGEIVRTKMGRPLVTVRDAGGEPTRNWRASVADFVGRAWGNRPLLDQPLFVKFIFYFPRPSSHFGSGRNANLLKASAPPFPAVMPDATKLVRAVEDACTGVLWKDDARIVRQAVGKFYGDKAGCVIKVLTLGSCDDEAAIDAAVAEQEQSDEARVNDKPHTAAGDQPGSATRGAAVERHKRILGESIDAALIKANLDPNSDNVDAVVAHLTRSTHPAQAMSVATLEQLVDWDNALRRLSAKELRAIVQGD